jgi:hypothetical protein
MTDADEQRGGGTAWTFRRGADETSVSVGGRLITSPRQQVSITSIFFPADPRLIHDVIKNSARCCPKRIIVFNELHHFIDGLKYIAKAVHQLNS